MYASFELLGNISTTYFHEDANFGKKQFLYHYLSFSNDVVDIYYIHMKIVLAITSMYEIYKYGVQVLFGYIDYIVYISNHKYR